MRRSLVLSSALLVLVVGLRLAAQAPQPGPEVKKLDQFAGSWTYTGDTAATPMGVPVKSKDLKGLDSLLSIVQMPKGVPVGTLAIGEAGAANAGLMAAAILALGDEALAGRLDAYRAAQTQGVGEDPR